LKVRPNRVSAGRTGWILLAAVLVPLLVLLVLLLPPISLADRISSAGYTSVPPQTASSLKDPDGTELTIPEGAVVKGGSIKLTSMPQAEFAASQLAQMLPNYLEVKSPYY
jgi:hypothetical protein